MTAPMRWAMRKKPVRVQFRPTSEITSLDCGTRHAAAAMNAADDGSPGTWISSSSSSSTWLTVPVSPSRSNGTRAWRIMRSVWSRLMVPSVIEVRPEASIPAISTQDLTWALGTGMS